MKYRVSVTRTEYASKDIEVEAVNPEAAKKAALDIAGDYEFREHDVDYNVDSVVPL